MGIILLISILPLLLGQKGRKIWPKEEGNLAKKQAAKLLIIKLLLLLLPSRSPFSSSSSSLANSPLFICYCSSSIVASLFSARDSIGKGYSILFAGDGKSLTDQQSERGPDTVVAQTQLVFLGTAILCSMPFGSSIRKGQKSGSRWPNGGDKN